MMRPGEQPVFSRFEEESFVSYIEAMSDFGFPLTQMDFRYSELLIKQIRSKS